MSIKEARAAVAEVISENIKFWGYTNKEVAILSGLHETTIAKLLSGTIDVNLDHSQRLASVFRDWTSTTLIEFYKKKIESLKKDEKYEEMVNFLETTNKFKLVDELSLQETVKHIFPGNSRESFNNFLLNSNVCFSQYKDKALAQLWVALMFNKYASIVPKGEFKKSSGPTVFKNVFDRFFTNESFEIRFVEIQKYLDKNGIFVVNGPFIKNSSIRGVSFNKNHQRYIFLSDMSKREFWWLLSLVHEMLHFYSTLEQEVEICKESERLIKTYITKNNIVNKDFAAFFKKQDSIDWGVNDQEAKDEYFAWLQKNTSQKISFGEVEDLL